MFDGLVVCELATVLAGPSVGQFFAELGARVIKVENVRSSGDGTRQWFGPQEDPLQTPLSAYFSSCNWGKESLAVDLRAPAGQQIVRSLAQRADVVLASFKRGDAEKLGVDASTLCGLNPRLVYGSISGYGVDSALAGYDAVVQAETGFMFMNGKPDSPPTKMCVWWRRLCGSRACPARLATSRHTTRPPYSAHLVPRHPSIHPTTPLGQAGGPD